MELFIGAVICIVVAGILIYSMKDEEHNGWDD